MQRYELVVLIDPKLNKEDIAEAIKNIEWTLWDSIKQKDEIGFLDLVTEIKSNNRAYFLSYEIEIDTDLMKSADAELKLMKPVLRYFFYKMAKNEIFFKFAEMSKKFEVSEEESRKQKDLQAFKEMDAISRRK